MEKRDKIFMLVNKSNIFMYFFIILIGRGYSLIGKTAYFAYR